MLINVKCDWCGKEYQKLECYLKGKKHHFCSRDCLACYSNKTKNPDKYNELKDYSGMSRNMSELNKKLNPTRMTTSVRTKLRESKLKHNSHSYKKLFGRHEHRVVAESVLGRALLPNEVVHHIDGNKLNNSKENLMIFHSQSEHAKWHSEHRKGVV